MAVTQAANGRLCRFASWRARANQRAPNILAPLAAMLSPQLDVRVVILPRALDYLLIFSHFLCRVI